MSNLNKETNINLALQACQIDSKLSLRRAASIFDVAYKTLYRRQQGTPSRGDIADNSRELSDLEKKIIVEYIFELKEYRIANLNFSKFLTTMYPANFAKLAI